MPQINSSLIPLVTAGSLFPALTDNSTLAIRWLTPNDPHFFDVYNRPMADMTVRQLILAKSVDQLGLSIGARNNFPFLNPPTVDVSTSTLSLPVAWVWDMHVTIKDSYENVRLATLQRFSGESNATDDDFTGIIRMVFAGNIVGSSNEVGLFYVDYQIDSSLTYQIKTIRPVTVNEHPNPLPSTEESSIAGFVVLRTLDVVENESFFISIAPPDSSGVTDASTIDPIDYEISDTPAGGSSIEGDFSFSAVLHGTGLLIPSSYNVVPPVGATELTILSAINYPWKIDANLVSNDQIVTIPSLLFSELSITAPMGNRSSDVGDNYPVVLNRVRRLDSNANSIEFVFSTRSTIIGDDSSTLIEFASVVLDRTMEAGDEVEIVPLNNIKSVNDPLNQLFSQNFGSGFAKLSSQWGLNSAITDFFDSFKTINDEPADRFFNAVLSDFSVERTPLNIPTVGEASALAGSTARRSTPINPSDDNRYVTESDQGLGDKIDFRDLPEFDPNDDIDPIAYSGSFLAKSFVLKVNTSNEVGYDYSDDILPRIVKLLGRNPVHGDEWFDGTTFKKYDQLSDAWIG